MTTQLKLERGMLLLDPGGEFKSPAVWCVVSTRKIVCLRDGVKIEATLKPSGLPKDWQVIDNSALAGHLIALAGHDVALPTGRILTDG